MTVNHGVPGSSPGWEATPYGNVRLFCYLVIYKHAPWPFPNIKQNALENDSMAFNTLKKKMMGGLIFMVRDAMCVGLDFDKKNNQDRLMVRVGQLDYENLLHQKGSSKMDFTGKVMRGFLFIEPAGFDLEEDLDFWISKAIEFNRIIKPSV